MPLDTAAKRRIWIFPIADGTIGASDRVHVGCGYSGITIAEPGGQVGEILIVFERATTPIRFVKASTAVRFLR